MSGFKAHLSFQFKLLANMQPKRQQVMADIVGSLSYTQGDPDGVPGSQVRPVSDLMTEDIWGIKQQVSFYHPLTLLFKQVNINKNEGLKNGYSRSTWLRVHHSSSIFYKSLCLVCPLGTQHKG